VFLAEPAQAGQHLDRGDEPVAGQRRIRRGQDPTFEAVGHLRSVAHDEHDQMRHGG
jgi:hypothetical protein